ncbi:MAG TPA: hypothetical protein VOB72_07220 [Candidatus Dormibacteraeota bacterium]|nr:hypothetical protein [Candidatus Dormibacteraeota bacterium]
MTGHQAIPESGVIEGVAVLDLTAHTAEAISRIKRIVGVALVLVPESLAGELTHVPMQGVARVLAVPDGGRARIHTGVVTMAGSALAVPNADNDFLVMTGVMVLTSPVTEVTYRGIVATGVLLAPRGSEAALAAKLMAATGTTAYYDYAEGQTVRVFQGQTRLRGEALANRGGQPNDIAIVAGQLVVTTPAPSVGFQQIVVAGQLAAPEASVDVLEPQLAVFGQVAWYTGAARAFAGADRFGRAFLELLPEPLTLVLSGAFTFEPDVPADLLREKVAAIVLSGALKGPRELVPVLQLLTVEKQGVIGVLDEEP